MYLRWILYFIPALIVEILCFLTSPIACLFVFKESRTDRVKRFSLTGTHTMDREYLKKPFWYLWQTHDNAADEYWYGLFTESSWFKFVREATQEDYDNSWGLRYLCRVLWCTRNIAYGWHYLLFSVGQDEGFKIEKEIPLGFGFVNHVNIGWKSHKLMPRKLYANRVFKLKKKEIND
jgi:hypothetical protein